MLPLNASDFYFIYVVIVIIFHPLLFFETNLPLNCQRNVMVVPLVVFAIKEAISIKSGRNIAI